MYLVVFERYDKKGEILQKYQPLLAYKTIEEAEQFIRDNKQILSVENSILTIKDVVLQDND